MNTYVNAVEKHRQRILDTLDYIWKNPEVGYREWKTHAYLKEQFQALGYTVTEAGNIPGFTAQLDTGLEGPTLLIFGELDGLLIPDHPQCDPQTGAVHACGHCAQAAALVGVAAALKEPGVLDGLCGRIRLVAVPAEELIELEYRQQLRADGQIKYFGGKPEFLYRGLLDGGDIAFMVHTGSGPAHTMNCNTGSNGMMAKTAVFEGVSAHAGSYPQAGINALYAANLALSAVNALRETFRDQDHIRVHPIITAGGSSVNAIPDRVMVESYVRGADMRSVADVNRRVNRAMSASAAAMGAKLHITDLPGYWPRNNPADFRALFREACGLAGVEYIDLNNWGTGCSDMGDISSLMPALHPNAGGSTGKSHGVDFQIPDPDTACVDSAKVQVLAARLLLEKGARRAREIIANYKPAFQSKEAYFAFVDSLDMDRETVSYEGQGHVSLDFTKA